MNPVQKINVLGLLDDQRLDCRPPSVAAFTVAELIDLMTATRERAADAESRYPGESDAVMLGKLMLLESMACQAVMRLPMEEAKPLSRACDQLEVFICRLQDTLQAPNA